MRDFKEVAFSAKLCTKELADFEALLRGRQELSERKDILPFFRRHNHLSLLAGALFPYITTLKWVAYEYRLFGDFACDLVVADRSTHTYVLLEFEDAKRNSVFCRGEKWNCRLLYTSRGG